MTAASSGAGSFDKRIRLERATVAANSFNEPVQTWSLLLYARAMREDVSDSELVAAGLLGAYGMSRFTVRRNSVTDTLTAADRIVYEGSNWNIKGVKRVAKNARDFIEITAVRKSS